MLTSRFPLHLHIAEAEVGIQLIAGYLLSASNEGAGTTFSDTTGTIYKAMYAAPIRFFKFASGVDAYPRGGGRLDSCHGHCFKLQLVCRARVFPSWSNLVSNLLALKHLTLHHHARATDTTIA